MMVTFQEVVAEIEVEAQELSGWIEQSWLLPVEDKGRYLFDEADVARARLIVELRRDMGVNDEAVPVILRLLDQVHALRKALSELNGAIKTLPPELREQLKGRLDRGTGEDEPGG